MIGTPRMAGEEPLRVRGNLEASASFSPDNRHYHFRSGQMREAADLVVREHYSRRVPSNVQFVGSLHDDGGLFGDFGAMAAAVFFSIPPTRWAEPVLELSRLVRRLDAKPPLSSLISQACRTLARECSLVVSFADWTQGHHGGVYQACSWNYGGQRGRNIDGVLIDGTFVPGRSCNNKYGTQSVEKLRGIIGASHDVQPHYDEGKHLYWKALTKDGKRRAARLGLASLPYPKPLTNVVGA